MNWKNALLSNIPREGEGVGAGAGDAAAQAAAAAAAAAAQKPWYEGKADAETIGHWDNKGWKKDDPAAVAIEATKQARELQKHFGVPPEQLIKLPKDAADEAGWKGVYSRLGVPTEAKDYDIAAVKHADGKEIDAALADTIRNSALAARVPKDRIGEFAKGVVKHLDDTAKAAKAEFDAKVATEKTALAKNWGTTPDKLDNHPNMLAAKLGAARANVSPEEVAALEKIVGYARTMEHFRKIHAGTSEDTFVEGGGKGNGLGMPMTKDGAKARLEELQGDSAWRTRLLDGGAAERREFDSLTQMIAA